MQIEQTQALATQMQPGRDQEGDHQPRVRARADAVSVPLWQRMSDTRSGRILAIVVVVGVHLGVLGWLVATRALPEPIKIEPPALVGMLVSMPAESIQPRAPVPAPVKQSKPVANPQPTMPVPKAAASERAVTAPEPVPVAAAHAEPTTEASRSAPVTPAPAVPDPEPPAPVVLPRSDAAYLNNPSPSYPLMARRMQQQGQVLLDVYILPNGTVGDLKVKRSSGFTVLDDAAVESVRKWRFVPAKRGNEAIAYWYTVPVDFSLNR